MRGIVASTAEKKLFLPNSLISLSELDECRSFKWDTAAGNGLYVDFPAREPTVRFIISLNPGVVLA